MRNLKVAKH